ncbi:ABC transporter ATP-binding protein [Serpentinicella sp. ANB-PHB4]|uniref:ABC transporter ATP-binding protein n=1 Tax=Serpentinicella sp. ANB-PHB4 TaxID=3074076 RepID=UPI002855C462|nr:ABC transporter ATP-binding protein [Serpentinicella sp. ANB-PHB4]MDR5658418.1 ABC transporter ATP-binding protein [Serpentinicella sp. ANB-PHB4]
MLKVSHLKKQYGKVEAVKGIDFEVKPGEILGFLGPNGAGKTTTIKICSGLLLPTEGQVNLCGYDIVTNPTEAKKHLGYVPDDPFLYDKLTGRQFLNFVGEMYGVDPKLRIERIDYLLDRLDLQEKSNELIGGYSRGMKRKIALMAGIIHQPKILLLDEPTLGLDAVSAKNAKDIVKEMAYKENTAVLLTTHVMEIAEQICDRIAVIAGGRLVAVGTLEELQKKAQKGTTLEEVFVNITSESDPVQG